MYVHMATLLGSVNNNYLPIISDEGGASVSARALSKVTQDGSVTSGIQNTTGAGGTAANSGSSPAPATGSAAGGSSSDPCPHTAAINTAGSWQLGEPLQKNHCACHRFVIVLSVCHFSTCNSRRERTFLLEFI